MWERKICIYGTLRIPNNFPVNKGHAMGINSDAILVAGAGIEVTIPFGDDDVRVGQVILVWELRRVV